MTQPYGLAKLETVGGQPTTSMIHGQGFELFLLRVDFGGLFFFLAYFNVKVLFTYFAFPYLNKMLN